MDATGFFTSLGFIFYMLLVSSSRFRDRLRGAADWALGKVFTALFVLAGVGLLLLMVGPLLYYVSWSLLSTMAVLVICVAALFRASARIQ